MTSRASAFVPNLPVGLARIQECGNRIADGPDAVACQVASHRRRRGGEHSPLDLGVLRDLAKPPGERLDRLVLGQQVRRGGHQRLDVRSVDLREQGLPSWEVAVEGALADPGRLGNLVEFQVI